LHPAQNSVRGSAAEKSGMSLKRITPMPDYGQHTRTDGQSHHHSSGRMAEVPEYREDVPPMAAGCFETGRKEKSGDAVNQSAPVYPGFIAIIRCVNMLSGLFPQFQTAR